MEQIPIKGAISYGLITVIDERMNKNKLFFGKPIIEAYLLEEEIKHMGFMLDGSVEKKVNSESKLMDLGYYNVETPLKSGLSSHYNLFHPVQNIKRESNQQKKMNL